MGPRLTSLAIFASTTIAIFGINHFFPAVTLAGAGAVVIALGVLFWRVGRKH